MGILSFLFDSSRFGPKKGPRDFNCARVHRGKYGVDSNEFARDVTVDFQILHGDAVVKRGRPIQVPHLESQTVATLQTFFIFPKSPYVRVMVKGNHGARRINLFREDDRRKSRMYKQRL